MALESVQVARSDTKNIHSSMVQGLGEAVGAGCEVPVAREVGSMLPKGLDISPNKNTGSTLFSCVTWGTSGSPQSLTQERHCGVVS